MERMLVSTHRLHPRCTTGPKYFQNSGIAEMGWRDLVITTELKLEIGSWELERQVCGSGMLEEKLR
jgi:hypothetical protein